MRRKNGKWKRNFVLGAAAGMMCMWGGLTAFAGNWQQDASGWWWQEDDGTYPVSEWKWIDGDRDGVSECYYFNDKGYCLMGEAAPDGSQVDENGAWVVDGCIQVSQTGAVMGNETGMEAGTELGYEEAKARLLAYYNNLRADDGNYVVMDSESTVSAEGYTFMIRYQMSDAEAQERMSRGGSLAANVLVSVDVVDKHTGIAWLGNGGNVNLTAW